MSKSLIEEILLYNRVFVVYLLILAIQYLSYHHLETTEFCLRIYTFHTTIRPCGLDRFPDPTPTLAGN
jgi:hypothetical protein